MSLLKEANRLFKEKQYLEAYKLYIQAKDLYNFSFLDHNIKKCLNELGNGDITNESFSSKDDIILPVYNALEFAKDRYDMNKYLNMYKDIKNNEINPLDHYINKGMEEGRQLFFSDSYIEKKKDYIRNKITGEIYNDFSNKKFKKKNVLFTFNKNPNRKITNPKIIDKDFEYIYFGVRALEGDCNNIWKYQPDIFHIDDMDLLNIFYCYNINILFPNADVKVWVTDFKYLDSINLKAIYKYSKSGEKQSLIFGKTVEKKFSIIKDEKISNPFEDNETIKKIFTKESLEAIHPNCIISKQENISEYDVLSSWWLLTIKYNIDFIIPTDLFTNNHSHIIPENQLSNDISSINIDKYTNIMENYYNKSIRCKLPLNYYINNFKNLEVSIILPVYNALEDVKKCLKSIETTTYNNYQIFIADDGSEKNVKEWLKNYSKGKSNIHLLSAKKNRGYTRNVNNAVKNTKSDFVILLNSDTLVHENWIEKLLIPAIIDKKVGIVGALSNAAGWQSIPYLRGDNTLPEYTNIQDINKFLEKNSHYPYYPMSDIVNGFCMCIRQEVFDKIGYFNEELFPKGYGEEDDFCMRARGFGFKNVISTDVYVHHSKSKSFGHYTRIKLATESRKILDKKYGKNGYKLLTESIGENPLINSKRKEIQNYLKLYNIRYSSIQKIAQIKGCECQKEVERYSVAIHIHLHYTEFALYFNYYLNKIPIKFDLYISINDSNANENLILTAFKNIENLNKIKIKNYPNRGRDVYPFFDMLKNVYKDYDFILHIHSKKSIHNPLFGTQWLSHLMNNLFYDDKYIQSILYNMKKKKIGLLIPPVIENLYPNYKWGKNKNIAINILNEIGVDTSKLNMNSLTFSAGNMFWANPKALKKLFEHNFISEDFPSEPIGIDGTLAHAIERSLDFVVRDAGYSTLVAEPFNKKNFKNEFDMFRQRMINHQKLESIILDKLSNKEPFSLVRFYDGEGAFYKIGNRKEKFIQERMRYYFGDRQYSKEEAFTIRDMILSSLNSASIIGIPNLDIVSDMLDFTDIYADGNIEKLPFIKRRYNKNIDCTSAWRIISSFELVINSLTTTTNYVTKDIHYEMVLNGTIYRILNNVKSVNVITSQPVSKYLKMIFGIDVKEYFIPPRALDNADFSNTNHYPEIFYKIQKHLQSNRFHGELFLVGGGPLGKAYCESIKSSGGIALDMGAVFDSWLNFHTRPEHVNKSNSFDKRLLLTSENVLTLTEGEVKPIKNVFESDLPKMKVNRFIK